MNQNPKEELLARADWCYRQWALWCQMRQKAEEEVSRTAGNVAIFSGAWQGLLAALLAYGFDAHSDPVWHKRYRNARDVSFNEVDPDELVGELGVPASQTDRVGDEGGGARPPSLGR